VARGKRAQAHTLRIIGGQWRGRRIDIGAGAELRPTPDRIRETLFDWLAPRITGARCLDLFAGTGALGLEALSRGAARVTFVERDRTAVRALHTALDKLGAIGAEVLQAGAVANAGRLASTHDIIFIDPPFTGDLHTQVLAALEPGLIPGTRIYLEYPARQADDVLADLPSACELLRNKRAGHVGYCLAVFSTEQS